MTGHSQATQDTIHAYKSCLRNGLSALQQPRTPDVLYHYTNGFGLIGILASGKIWATDLRYMNDASESTYASAVVRSVLQTHYDDASHSGIRSLLTMLLHDDQAIQCYATCFCEEGDLLNQWRVYSGRDGYALGIPGGALEFPTDERALKLIKMIYDESQQRALISKLLAPVLEFLGDALARLDSTTAMSIQSLAWHDLSAVLLEAKAAFKHPSFSAEHEWRLVFGSKNPGPIKYRVGPYGLTPYMEFELDQGEEFPLLSARFGPCAHPDNARAALEGFLATRGYAGVTVEGTSVPVRI